MGDDSDSGWDSAQAEDADSDEELDVDPPENVEETVDGAAEDENEEHTDAVTPKKRGRKPKRKPLPPVAPAKSESSYQKRAHSVVLLEDGTEEAAQGGPKKVRRVNFDEEYEEDTPSFARVTDRGGYAHTKTSRMKISEANKGKMPWNKGKNRTETAKSKISAGVRARNRAILLEKLKILGMTEEEWFAKKKEIKFVREKVRKARLAVKEHEKAMEKARKQKEEQDFKEAMVDAFELENLAGDFIEPIPEPAKKSFSEPRPSQRKLAPDASQTDTTNATGQVVSVGRFKDLAKAQGVKEDFPKFDHSAGNAIAKNPGPSTISNKKPAAKKRSSNKPTPTIMTAAMANAALANFMPRTAPQPIATKPKPAPPQPGALAWLMPKTTAPPVNEVSLSTRQIKWTPHPLGLPDASYSADCPEGGPGGLICCAICTAQYSHYLSSTFQDLESQQISALGDEVEEIMGYSRAATKLLNDSIKAAKRGR